MLSQFVALRPANWEVSLLQARDIHFDPNRGFFLNRQHVKLRGFCDFGPFGAVGAATPDRVHLYRAQILRSVGGNAWRMAHNPPAPGRLDAMDRVGMLALDENHYYGNHGAPYGIYSPEVLNQTTVDMSDLVRRDRNHPSIFAWNLCESSLDALFCSPVARSEPLA